VKSSSSNFPKVLHGKTSGDLPYNMITVENWLLKQRVILVELVVAAVHAANSIRTDCSVSLLTRDVQKTEIPFGFGF